MLIMKEYERFTAENYDEIEGLQKRYLTALIFQADYTDEWNFYKSLDILYKQFYKGLKNKEELEDLDASKHYISLMGLEESKKILIQLARKKLA